MIIPVEFFTCLPTLGQAELSPFFNWMPWLFMFLMPALGMPLWAEERRVGTFELTLSYPISLWELVFGKYLAGMALVAMALALTLPVPATIAVLGQPDAGSVTAPVMSASDRVIVSLLYCASETTNCDGQERDMLSV